MEQVMPENTFLQIDRCISGVRYTVRDGSARTSPIVETLVRERWMNDAEWDKHRRGWLGLQKVFADTPVRAWKDHAPLGYLDDLLEGRIDERADHG